MRTGAQMGPLRRVASVSDRTLHRLTRAGLLILLIGMPLFAVVYYMDQHVDAGPSLTDRQVAVAEGLVRKQPDNVALRLGLAQAYVGVGRRDSALVQYDEILKVEPGHRVALLGRGDLLRERGDLKGAAAGYQRLIGPAAKGEFAGADSTLAAALYGLAAVRLEEGRPDEAVNTLEKVLEIDPADADGWHLLGSAALKARDPARAAKAFRKAVMFVPTGWCEPYEGMISAYQALRQAPATEYARGMADFCNGRAGGARERLSGLTSGPVALDAMLGLGMIAEVQSDRAAAVDWYRKALKIDPKSFAALTGLSRMDQPAPNGSPAPPGHSSAAPSGGGT